MDRFKFRYWQQGCKQMEYIDSLYFFEENSIRDANDIPSCDALMQCTGLKDVNGNLIYEGDIVDVLSEVETTAEIKWCQDTAQFTIEFENICANFDNYHSNELEVVGNIYESKVSFSTKFGEQIRLARKRKGWSVQKLSKVSNVSVGLISELENGKRTVIPKFDTCIKIIRAFDKHLDMEMFLVKYLKEVK